MAEKLIDQTKLAESVAKKINYDFRTDFLVKPLPPIKVKKEYSVPVVDSSKPKKDKNGIEAVDYNTVTKEIKEVDSDFEKAVVIKQPFDYNAQNLDKGFNLWHVNIGDVIIYRRACAKEFDLLKDSKLVKYYDIIAIDKPSIDA